MSQREQGNRSRGEMEMEVIAMLRRLKVAPITITHAMKMQLSGRVSVDVPRFRWE